ncbi:MULTISPECIES: cation-translocating P-type ATPase [Ramlibacter]|uniref:Cadmium-translocating P-type ATPase n=1 Tax=Ramlibacter aquaticus TaxID=2780094 RepID=A0ABR9SBC0_9BURK|nr:MULTISPECIES: cation-translocating P-type ATPase [Ramlibacter]MBE7939641.1 cadmium-translocating P-type ATPase [Ramlibacter aquaticus]
MPDSPLSLAAATDGPQDRAAAWTALDQPAEWRAFSRELQGQGGRVESWLAIEGMECPGCALVVEDALTACPGVRSAQVNGSTATARVEWEPGAGRPSDWWAALQRAGYGALPAGDQLDAQPRRRARRMMLWRWLVAGFCMMQVMMYAVPVYMSAPGEMSADALGLMRWAAWLLTLPVLLFSCKPFFASAWRDLRHLRLGMDVPVALGILIAYAASTAATFQPRGPLGDEVWFDSITMFVFFLLSGRMLEQRLRDRTAGALEALARRLPDLVERRSLAGDGRFERVPVRTLVPGDCIRVLPGEVIPADGLVLAGDGQVDEAILTGESQPLRRTAGQPVVAGSHNLSGTLVIQVLRCGPDTRFAEIVGLMERASVEKPRVARQADRVAGWFLGLVVLASAGGAAWWWPAGHAHAIGVAIAVLIVTCPCALSLATPAATLAAAGALARRGIVVRRLQALEAGASVDTVIFDKTGTLTQAELALGAVRCREGLQASQALALAGALAACSLHPASRALARAAGEGLPPVRGTREEAGRGVRGEVWHAGAWQALRLGSAAFCGVQDAGAGSTQVHLADAQGWLASFQVDEALREDAPAAVAALAAQGLGVQLLSGDTEAAAQRLAQRAGIARAEGGQTPEAKLARVAQLQQQGRRIAMVGDGMNDGPVLARADLSIAMGHAVPLAQAQADFVVPGERLSAVPLLLAQARRCRRVVRENLAWAAAYNMVCVPLAVAGAMPPWLAGLGMAASSLFVVMNSARLARLPQDA